MKRCAPRSTRWPPQPPAGCRPRPNPDGSSATRSALRTVDYPRTAHNLARADRRGIELLGPMMPDNAWRSAEGNGFAVSDFTIDWDNRVMTCPTGATSLPWASEIDQGGTPVIRVRFSMRDCRNCPSRDLCTRGTKGRPITLRPREEHEALQTCPAETKHRRMAATLRSPGRHRGHHRPRCQRLRPAAVPLPQHDA
ncbi:hypothetical protein GBF35_35605 [Nonomuraea phyllanthi]|nr:hypothetical protein GBF35_35605 [Nonomuraea phyllanthi]